MRKIRIWPSVEDRFWPKVDKNGFNGCWIWVASKYASGYGAFGWSRRRIMAAHRVAYELLVGPIPEGRELDHVCHNRACVNPEHLRPCSHAENSRNVGVKSSNKSGFKGVSWHRGARKWRATIFLNAKQIHLGFHLTKESAHEAYCMAASNLHGEFANTGRAA